ncbi:replicative DNA helicase [Planctomycetota bacterium]
MAATIVDRLPPQNLDAEHAVLGAMLLYNDCIGELVQKLSSEHFYKTGNAVLFEALVKLYDENQKIDLVILNDYLAGQKKLDAVGGVAFLMELLESVPSAANAEYYAGIVIEKATQRMLLNACNNISQRVYESGAHSDELLDAAEREIFAIAEHNLSSETYFIRDVVMELTKIFINIKDRKERIQGLNTEFYELDDMTGGLQPGELLILAARPSMGKTTLALNIMDNISVKNKKPVLFFSVEMARRQVVTNMLCSKAGIPSEKFRKGYITNDDMKQIQDGSALLYEGQLYIDDTPAINITQLRAKARRMKAKHDIELVVVDYLQLLSGGGRIEHREQEISLISRSLKSLARELSIPVLAVAQLNRNVEGRQDHTPMLSDLRESGSIEQDADVILFLTREDYYHPENPDLKGKAKLFIAKQRNGPTGVVELAFKAKFMRFMPLSLREED